MGNIYLRFGKPTTVVKRHHETDYYPYEIWHYYRAGRFTNKRFLFYAPHVVGECFELLHSDMLGERQNDDWLSQLRSRENRLRVTESMENRLNPRDAFSREEPEDLFTTRDEIDPFNGSCHPQLEWTSPFGDVPALGPRAYVRRHRSVGGGQRQHRRQRVLAEGTSRIARVCLHFGPKLGVC